MDAEDWRHKAISQGITTILKAGQSEKNRFSFIASRERIALQTL